MEKILVFMSGDKNCEIIENFFKHKYDTININDESLDNLNDDFSLLITDLPSWNQNHELLKSRKENEKPLFLPYLLVTPLNDLKMMKNEIWENFDEVITIPITKAILLARVKVLIQTRKLSVQVNQLMNDKEMLLKEIHHRVKNNLMIIASLLSMQSRDITDEKSKSFFRESQNRAKSMALIHERLYRSTDLKNINIKDYISSLAKELFSTYVTDPDKVKLEIDVEEIKIDINFTIPLGLILNELITNSLKYAFPGDRKGKLKVKLYKENNEYILILSDDGVGFPEEFDYRENDSLGMQLINNLTDQLGGELKMEKKHGTKFLIKLSGKKNK